MARATLAAKFWTTRFVMLWQSGVIWPNFLTIAGTPSRSVWTSLVFLAVLLRLAKGGGLRSKLRSSEAAILGFGAAMMALTTATPSRALKVALDWYITRWTLLALMPPMATVATFSSIADRAFRIPFVPAVPMIDLVFSLLAEVFSV